MLLVEYKATSSVGFGLLFPTVKQTLQTSFKDCGCMSWYLLFSSF